MRTLTREQIEAIRDSRLPMDALVRDTIRKSLGVRFMVVDDYRTAVQLESAIKCGQLQAGRPRLNPTRQRDDA